MLPPFFLEEGTSFYILSFPVPLGKKKDSVGECRPIAFDVGTTAPEMMLLPYNNEPDTGSRIPSLPFTIKKEEAL